MSRRRAEKYYARRVSGHRQVFGTGDDGPAEPYLVAAGCWLFLVVMAYFAIGSPSCHWVIPLAVVAIITAMRGHLALGDGGLGTYFYVGGAVLVILLCLMVMLGALVSSQ